MVIQFICRGNAFRSIIAEAYLKSLQIPGLRVFSSGTVANVGKAGNKVYFSNTLALLKRHGLERFAKDHYGDSVTQSGLDESDIAVCVNKIAYDEAAGSFTLPEKTFVWDVADVGEGGRVAATNAERESFMEDVYKEIVKNVDELVRSSQL